MPLRNIAGAKGTLKACESDVNHLGIGEILLVYLAVGNWDIVMTWAARESSRLLPIVEGVVANSHGSLEVIVWCHG